MDGGPNGAPNGARPPPLVNSDFLLYKVPGRRNRARRNVNNRRGVRLGPNANGEYANRLGNPQYVPLALRKSHPRKVLGFLSARGRFGFPAPTHAGAFLGYSAMGHRSWATAPGGKCDARRFILIRPVGLLAEGRDASSKSRAQEATVGFRPCCVKAAHIAAPMAFELGASRWKEKWA